MKKLFFLALFFACTPFIYANVDQNISEQETNIGHTQNINEQAPAPMTTSETKLIYMNLRLPTRYLYVGEILAIEYEAMVLGENPSYTKTSFFGESNVTIMNKDSRWVSQGDNKYTNTVYVKILNEKAVLPGVDMRVEFASGITQEESIAPKPLSPIRLKNGQFSCNVIANDLYITNEKVTTYDKMHNLAVLEIEANNANISEFFINNIEKQGIETLELNYPRSKIVYFTIVPKTMTVLRFEYFNKIQNKFIPLVVENDANDEGVSTQSDIKPKQTYQVYKIFLVAIGIAVLLYFAFRRRRILYVLLSLPLLLYLLQLLEPQKEIVVKSGARMSILPTENSTIFYVTDGEIASKVLLKRGDFYKIQIGEDKIGWIRKEDARED